MKLIPTLLLALAATPAMAHPTHVASAGGHDHIVAAIAIVLAIGVALLSARSLKKQSI